MATNDFLPFAVGAGANVLSQSDYAAQTAIASGYSAGIAKSAALNKTWRQSSIMAAVLAQFIANQTGANSVDDGTTATLLANLLAAVKTATNVVVGAARNLAMSVTAASASATMTADEIIVESALGGLTYKVTSFNKTINLATTGAGGMDTGTAPVSGWVGIYAIYNPTTGASGLLATTETAALPSVYGGANMPAGYTASALVSVWQTNASRLLTVGYQRDRHINTLPINVLTNGAGTLTPIAFSIAGAVPKSAVRFYSNTTMSVGAGTTSCSFYLCATAQGTGIGPVAGVNNTVTNAGGGTSPTDIFTPQTSYYVFGGTSVQTPASNIVGANGYDI